MPKIFVTIRGKRVPVSSLTSIDRPYFMSKDFHDKGNSILENEIAYHNRQITALNKMPVSKFTNNDILYHQKFLTAKRKELEHRRSMAKSHNLRW